MSGMDHLVFYGPRCDKCGEKIALTSPVLGVCHLCYTDFDMARFDAIPPPNKEQQTENDELEVKK